MLHDKDFEYYEKIAHWSFDEYDCHTESLTDWDLYEILKSVATPDSHVLDLGTGGCAEIVGTDYSPNMVATALENLAKSGRKNITFRVMDNLHMDVPDGHFDVVVARHTCIDAEQIMRCLKPEGFLLIVFDVLTVFDCDLLFGLADLIDCDRSLFLILDVGDAHFFEIRAILIDRVCEHIDSDPLAASDDAAQEILIVYPLIREIVASGDELIEDNVLDLTIIRTLIVLPGIDRVCSQNRLRVLLSQHSTP